MRSRKFRALYCDHDNCGYYENTCREESERHPRTIKARVERPMNQNCYENAAACAIESPGHENRERNSTDQ